MCTAACLDFGRRALSTGEVVGKRVLEVGSLDVNGSLRPMLESGAPSLYVGVDIAPGPGVDEICDVSELVHRFGNEAFDLVICTEGLEHFLDWRGAVSNLKRVLRPGGALLVTTRSEGFPLHDYPFDYWRFSTEDMRILFGDCSIELLESDPAQPGVFLKATRPPSFREFDLAGHELYSIVRLRRIRNLTSWDVRIFSAVHELYPDVVDLVDVWVRGGRSPLLPFPTPHAEAIERWERRPSPSAEVSALRAERDALRDRIQAVERSKGWRLLQSVRAIAGRRW